MDDDQPSHDHKSPEPAVLPFAVIELLFTKLGVAHGHNFLGNWAGMDLSAVKTDWRYKLAGITAQQLDYAVQNVPPGKPPKDAMEFRRLCQSMPDERRLNVLPPPRGKVDVPPKVKALLDELSKPRDPKEPPARVRWATRYVELHGKNLHLTPMQKSYLAHAQKVLARHDEDKRLDAAKAATQQAVDAYQSQPEGDNHGHESAAF